MARDNAARRGGVPPFVMFLKRVWNSHAIKAASPTDRALLVDLFLQAGASNNGALGTHLSDNGKECLYRRGWRSSNTVFNAAFNLEVLGLIECENEGRNGISPGGKNPKLWSVTWMDVFDMPHKGISGHPARHSYEHFQSVEQARAALDKAWEQLEQQRREKFASKMQKLHRVGAETASKTAKVDAETAHGEASSLQKLHRAESRKTPRKSSNGAGCEAIQPHEGTDNAPYAVSAHLYRYTKCSEQSAGSDSPSLMASGPKTTAGPARMTASKTSKPRAPLTVVQLH
jgi:hypothetical protein